MQDSDRDSHRDHDGRHHHREGHVRRTVSSQRPPEKRHDDWSENMDLTNRTSSEKKSDIDMFIKVYAQ
jgi:hypothetical protein